mgnify:CR=1 FL=1
MCPDFYAGAVPKTGTCRFTLNCAAGLLNMTAEIKKLSPTTVVKLFNISKFDKNDIMTQVFKSKAIAVGSPTVCKSILSSVSGWLHFLQELSLKGKKAAVFGCYGWSGEGNKVLREELTKAGFDVIDAEERCSWNPRVEDLENMANIASALLS